MFKKIMFIIASAGFLFASAAHAAPAGSAAAISQEMAKALHEEVTQTVNHRRRHYHRRHYHRGHRYHARRVHHRRAYRPVRYGYAPRTVCRIRHQRVFNSYGYSYRPVRVCYRR